MIEAMLGPTGNLRAPTLRAGDTVVIGYNDDVFDDLFRRRAGRGVAAAPESRG